MKQKFVEVQEPVRQVLRECSAFDGVLKLPERDLGKKLYSEVKRVIEAADGHWSKKEQGFTFERPALERLNAAIVHGSMLHRKQSYQEFLTPPDLALKLVDLVVEHFRSEPIAETALTVLEPSAGTGVLVNALLEQYQGASICACELQKHNLDCIPNDLRIRKVHGDFLKQEWPGPGPGCNYHVVIMNPPFGGKTWVKHVLHALRFVREDGILVAVVPRNAKLDDLGLTHASRAMLTPVNAIFDGTGVKASILTYGVKQKCVTKVVKSIQAPVSGLVDETHSLKSPEYYIKKIREDLNESMRCLDELDSMLNDK